MDETASQQKAQSPQAPSQEPPEDVPGNGRWRHSSKRNSDGQLFPPCEAPSALRAGSHGPRPHPRPPCWPLQCRQAWAGAPGRSLSWPPPTSLAPGCGSPHLSLALALPSPGVPSPPSPRPSVGSAARTAQPPLPLLSPTCCRRTRRLACSAG